MSFHRIEGTLIAVSKFVKRPSKQAFYHSSAQQMNADKGLHRLFCCHLFTNPFAKLDKYHIVNQSKTRNNEIFKYCTICVKTSREFHEMASPKKNTKQQYATNSS